MIKGINHKIIEITETDSVYYSHAWLMVNPLYEEAEEAVLRREAKKLLSQVGTPSSIKGKRTVGFWFLRLVPTLAAGVGIGVLTGLFF